MLTDEEVAALGERGWFSRDDFLGEAYARAAHAEVVAWGMRGKLRPGGVSRAAVLAPEVRADSIAWVERGDCDAGLGALWDRFDALGLALREEAWLGTGKMDVQIARYPGQGAAYARHRDAFDGPAGRRATAIWYANPAWHPACGGVLRLYPDGQKSADLEPLLDRLVVFLAARVEHEVLPAWAERWAVTAWYSPP